MTNVKIKPVQDSTAQAQEKMCFANQALKPVLFLMRLTGVLHTTSSLDLKETCRCRLNTRQDVGLNSTTKQSKYWRIGQITYITLVNILMLSSTVEIVYCSIKTQYRPFSVQSQQQISLTIILSTANVIQPFTMVQFSKNLESLFRRICAVQQKYSLHITWGSVGLNRFGVFVAVFVALTPSISAFILVFCDSKGIVAICKTIFVCTVEDGNRFLLVMVNSWVMLANTTSILATILCSLLYVAFCNTSSRLFHECCNSLRSYNELNETNSGGGDLVPLKDILQFHEDVCDIVRHGNDVFKYFILMVYVMTVPPICLSTSAITGTPFGSDAFIAGILAGLVVLTFLFTIIYKASNINEYSSKLLTEVFRLKPLEPNGKDIQLASFFVAKLTELPSGVSLMNTILITRGHIVTLLGILATYTAVLFQMKPNSGCEGLHSNETVGSI